MPALGCAPDWIALHLLEYLREAAFLGRGTSYRGPVLEGQASNSLFLPGKYRKDLAGEDDEDSKRSQHDSAEGCA